MKYNINGKQCVKLKDDVFSRIDNNSLSLLFNKTTGLQFMEGISTQIFSLIKEGKSLNEMLEILNDKYKDVSEKILESDLIDFLYELEINDIIEWDKADYITNYMGVVQEKDYRQLEKYYLEILNMKLIDKKKTNFLSVKSKNYFHAASLRTEHMMGNDTYFIISNEKEITTSISFYGLNAGIKTLMLANITDKHNSEENIIKLFNYCKDYFKELGFKKIKFQCVGSNEIPILSLVKKMGMTYETTLRKDFNNLDVHVYSLFL